MYPARTPAIGKLLALLLGMMAGFGRRAEFDFVHTDGNGTFRAFLVNGVELETTGEQNAGYEFGVVSREATENNFRPAVGEHRAKQSGRWIVGFGKLSAALEA